MRKIAIVFCLLFSFLKGYSQQSIADLYRSYTVIRTTNDNKLAAINIALDLLKRSSELTNTQIANLNFNLGRLYEETKQVEMASPYYEESLKQAPDYYVTHRALGNIYLKRSFPIAQKMNEAAKAQQTDVYTKLFAEYKKLISKVIPHLEKAQACDPDEQTLQQLKNLYKNIKDATALNTLDERLKKLAVTCVDLLED
jgi:tetratricopeptide (TPR) repeat protein